MLTPFVPSEIVQGSPRVCRGTYRPQIGDRHPTTIILRLITFHIVVIYGLSIDSTIMVINTSPTTIRLLSNCYTTTGRIGLGLSPASLTPPDTLGGTTRITLLV